MSQYSPNPYDAAGQQQPSNSQFPLPGEGPVVGTTTKLILIMFLIFGILGVIGGCLGIGQLIILSATLDSQPGHAELSIDSPVSLAAHESATKATLRVVANKVQYNDDLFAEDKLSDTLTSDEDSSEALNSEHGHEFEHLGANDELAQHRAMTKQMLAEPFPGAMAISILIGSVSILLSLAMAIGGGLGLGRKLFGLNLVKWTAAALIPFKLVETTFSSIYTYMKRADILMPMKQEMAKQPKGAEALESMASMFDVLVLVGIAVAVIWGILLICFYIYVFFHTSRPDVRAAFE